MIVCSIDLMGGQAVQLRRGQGEPVVRVDDVVGLARRFGRVGEVAVIDLDAAIGGGARGDNEALIRQLCAVAPCRVGGGIRDVAKAERLLRAGARRIILGTAATADLLSKLPRERVIVAVDEKGGRVADHGWTRSTPETALERAQRLAPYCAGFLYTQVDSEGMMGGIDLGPVKALREALPAHVGLTAAGGVTTLADIVALDKLGADAQVGMALYTGAFSAWDGFIAPLRFAERDGLIPTVVQAESGQVLMVAYSNAQSLTHALEHGVGAYWSRSRGRLWVKGEESGHTQTLRMVQADCDRDALLFRVEQTGPACHRNTATCFGDRGFDFARLFEVIRERLDEPPPTDSNVRPSWTRRLASDSALLKGKILEEATEFVDDEGDDNLVWEAADLLYHMAVKLSVRGVKPEALFNELWRRVK